jgi:hypothetical protein
MVLGSAAGSDQSPNHPADSKSGIKTDTIVATTGKHEFFTVGY